MFLPLSSRATSRRRSVSSTRYGALGLQPRQGTMNNFTFGNDRYQYYETIAGGVAPVPHDGASGAQTHMTNSRLTDPEVLGDPVPGAAARILRGARRFGGAGAHRGGDGLVRRIEFREPMTAAICRITRACAFRPCGR